MNKIFKIITISVFILVLISYQVICQEGKKDSNNKMYESPRVVEDLPKYFQTGNVFVGPQPDEDALDWFAENSVTLIINCRTESEIEKHTDEKFDKEECIEELGMKYVNLPLGGSDGYKPEAVDKFAKKLGDSDGKVLIHCTGGGRVSHLWAAYLVNYKNYSIEEALSDAKKMKLSFPFENLLGYALKIERK